jgi:hypothetical protein
VRFFFAAFWHILKRDFNLRLTVGAALALIVFVLISRKMDTAVRKVELPVASNLWWWAWRIAVAIALVSLIVWVVRKFRTTGTPTLNWGWVKPVFGVAAATLLIWLGYSLMKGSANDEEKRIASSGAGGSSSALPDSVVHVFEIDTVTSKAWKLPTHLKGYGIHVNASDLSIPYMMVTDHDSTAYIPGENCVDLGSARSLAFRVLMDTTLTVTVVLKKPDGTNPRAGCSSAQSETANMQ